MHPFPVGSIFPGFKRHSGSNSFLKRAIQSEIENPLAKRILEGEFGPKDRVKVDARGGKIVFQREPGTVSAAA